MISQKKLFITCFFLALLGIVFCTTELLRLELFTVYMNDNWRVVGVFCTEQTSLEIQPNILKLKWKGQIDF